MAELSETYACAPTTERGRGILISGDPKTNSVLTVSADKTAKTWEITEDGNGKVKRILAYPGSGGLDDMLVGCLWRNDHLVTVSLGGMINIYSASDPDKTPISFSGHMKSITALACTLQSGHKVILSSNYDGVIIRWIQGIGYHSRMARKDNTQIKCFAAVEEEIVTSGFDNKNQLTLALSQRYLNLAVWTPELAFVSTDSEVIMLRGLQVVSSIKLAYTATASTISPDGSEAIVGGQDGKMHICSISRDILKEEAVLEKHRGTVTVIRYSPDASMFASADANREAVVWDRVSRERYGCIFYRTYQLFAFKMVVSFAFGAFIFGSLRTE
ncbi:putative Actin-interacting protein 1-2 [Cocos nucifera]|uniref:Putative Actin-interacting protein 1-2 n=1 Tax=Cocos nucifera TaxID=13894 RepID=A0A8K0MYT4_COCNU|nr:putative Actin-interacting protein 1-2 [Cocos nucifera]